MKVLVTGGGGFVGGAVCRMLLARGDQVVAFQRGEPTALMALGAAAYRGDIADTDAVREAAQGCDAVIHTAARAGAWGPRAAYVAANITGTDNVISACREHGIDRLVFTSSPSVVHAGGDIENGDESLPYPGRFHAAYPETKAASEQAVLAANGRALKTVALRPHLVWGPGDNHLLPRLVERAKQGPLRLPAPEKLIDTVYIDNAAMAHLGALDALDSNPRCRGQAYFITNAEPLPTGEIITRLLAAVGQPVDIQPISPKMAYVAGLVCEAVWTISGRNSEPPVTRWAAEQLSTAHWFNPAGAERDLGYRPAISIAEGLERLAASAPGRRA